ncbi:MAG: peptide ABC transporter substrate-binding protein [Chloroflexi bacterium]|nr:peptide ABC transporter substrate-binding protein [Chloroflexota bacterium]
MRKKTFWLFGLLIMIGLLVVACGAPTESEDSSEPEDTTQAEESETAVEAEEPAVEAEEPAAETAEETSIVIAIPEAPSGFNSYVGGGDYKRILMELVLLGLSDIDADGNIFPELAAELPTIENGGVDFDEEAWTMDVTWKLRDDIQWADGTPVTADDVMFTWEAMTDEENGTWFDGVDYTDSVEKIDDHTVIIHYNTVYPNYLVHFGGEDFVIWPAHYCDAEQGFINMDCNRNPLSNGPFMLDEWVEGDHITFVANPNYFEEGKPGIDKIFVRIVPDGSVTRQLFLEGDVDFQQWPGETSAEAFKEVDNVDVSYAPSDRWVMRLLLNGAAKGEVDPVEFPHPILSDVRVRQALRMALDTDTITSEIFKGYSSPMWTEFFRAPYECDIARPAYDPEAAAALLEGAGWTDEDGDGIRECHGCTTGAEEGYPMEMDFNIYAEYGESLELAQQFMAEMWNGIGVQTNLGIVEGTTLWAGYEEGGLEATGNFDIDMWDDGYPGVDPTDNLLWTYYYGPAAEPDVGYNIMRWVNEDFDALLDEAYTIDEEYRKELFCGMAEILEEEVPMILLWTAFDAAAHSSRLNGVQASVNDTHVWNVADWTVSEE